MMRNRLLCAAGLLATVVAVLAVSVNSFAQGTAAVSDVKFACSQHGPSDMQLTLSLEAGSPRTIEFIGGDDATKWIVKIDGKFAAAGNGGTNKDTVKVHSGDRITWSFAAKKHGVAFAEQDLAQAMLEFDAVFKPLVDQNAKLTTAAWMAFGSKRWGTDPTNELGIFAAGKVK